ncbi:MAG TPA: MFS transporter [Methylomirabilota bacterium]|nr:MFS transporter [Methylomirabilota bacterium]
MTASPLAGTALLCLVVFSSTICVGAFGPLLPEIARAQGLPDWQLGLLAGSFGFARMAADLPVGALATRRLASALTLAPITLLAGMLLLATAGPLPVLVLGRLLTGLAHTLVMVGSLTAVLQDPQGRRASMRLNTLEFSGMLGVLGGLVLVGLLPERWRWNVSLLVAASPVVLALGATLALTRYFPSRLGSASPTAVVVKSERAIPARSGAIPSIVRLMFALGVIMALAWSAVSQFVIPLRGTREFGLERAGISGLLSLAQILDLAVLLPVGWLADRVGRAPVLVAVAAVLGVGLFTVGLGSLPLMVLGCALFGLGMAGWMLPLGVIREHTDVAKLGWRTGVYRVGVDGAIFLGPLVCGVLGEAHTPIFIVLVGVASFAIAIRLLRP